MTEFTFEPADIVPFRDSQVLHKIRSISGDELPKHPNPDLTIRIVPDASGRCIQFSDVIARIRDTAAAGEPCVLIMGNPNPGYSDLAGMINRLQIDCRHVHIFNMDEWADEAGNTAPESYPQGFMRAMKKYFFHELDHKIRMDESQVHGPTTRNINDYSKMLADFGGANACYSGCGWTAHTAFIDPDVPEFSADLEQWKQQGARIVTLHPLTLAQNSLHASFGRCGDIAAVPPKAATIGPADMIGAKYRMDCSLITIGGSKASWQRLTIRLILHGPVTPQIPGSILQTVPTEFIIGESIAADIEPIWHAGY